ncbi:hypothetical protein BD779DRAFT_1575513 [Infundibulicybe gibba]|nr:hypothetical protein BD779DRAFT_1575513 [Infundibulicybe gibba]
MDAAGMSELVSLGQGFAYAGLIKFSLKSVGSGKFGHLSVLIGIAAYSISLGANALTTSLIVTKIFLTSRQVRSVLGPSSDRSIRIATAMLIESGLLMFAFQLVFIVLFSSGTTMVNIIFGPTAQRYGITPTLLNIRVMMGTAYDKTTENSTTSLRFAHSGGAATQTTGLSTSAAGVQFKGPRGIDTESDETSSDERATDDAV